MTVLLLLAGLLAQDPSPILERAIGGSVDELAKDLDLASESKAKLGEIVTASAKALATALERERASGG